MMTMEWKDRTSYNRRDEERVPKILELKAGKLRIVIHRLIHREGWYLTVYGLTIRDKTLDIEDLEIAKMKGIKVVVDEIKELEEIKGMLIMKLIG